MEGTGGAPLYGQINAMITNSQQCVIVVYICGIFLDSHKREVSITRCNTMPSASYNNGIHNAHAFLSKQF